MIKGTLEPEFNHSKVFGFNCVTDEHLEFFDHGCITLMLYGNQEDVKPDPRFMKMSTKVGYISYVSVIPTAIGKFLGSIR